MSQFVKNFMIKTTFIILSSVNPMYLKSFLKKLDLKPYTLGLFSIKSLTSIVRNSFISNGAIASPFYSKNSVL